MANKKKIDYQALSQRLDEVVAKMQEEDTSIDAMIMLYEEGVHLTQDLEKYLKEAENKLKKISESVGDS